MASGNPAEEPTNSYLRQFLTRGDGDRQEQPKRSDRSNTNGDGNISNESKEYRDSKRGGGNHCRPQPDDGSDDEARELRLPTPRCPPQRPTCQPSSPQTELDPGCVIGSAALDSGDGLERTTVRYPSAASSKHKDGGSGSGQCTRAGIGDPPRGQEKDFMVDGEDLLRLKSADAVGRRGSATFNDTWHQQRQKHCKNLASSSLDLHHRHGAGLSTRSAGGQQQHHQHRNDRGKGGEHALSAQESSTLFWEEVDSLDAKSSSANNDWGQRLGGGRGRGGDRNIGGESMAILGVHNGRSRGGGRSRRGGRGSGARGPPKSGVRQAAAFASPVIGGGTSVRKRHPRADLTSTELPLGQVLRTVGGLVGGEGLKVSAVGKHITSLEGVPSSVSSRATQLFLSNNSLRWLRGVEAFSRVVCLSISHNLVRRTEDLHPLSLLAHLEMLSLEGNPVCGAANYRAHVVSLASARLKTLDGREVISGETSDAPAIVVAERSATHKTSRECCLCLLLHHMSGLLECHAELREALLEAGSGCSTGGGGIGGDQLPSRFRQGGRVFNGRRVAWRQRMAVAMPVHHMLAVLQADSWPVFDQSELDVLERQTLEEAAEVLADVVTSRRAAGQRTNELLESAVATLNSPGTRMWVQVLGEVQRRTEGKVSDVVLRCESVRRREAERFRHVSGQTNTFLQDLAAAVGCSDNQWAVPPCKAAAVQRTAGASAGGGAPRNTRNTTPSMPLGASRPSSSISLPQPADKSRVRMLSSPERGRTVRTTLSRSCPVGIAGTVPVADTAQSPEAMAEESIVLDAPNRATENGGRGMAGAGKRDPPSPGHVARGIEGELATRDKTEALRSRSASPALLGAQSEAGAVGQGTTVVAVERVPEVAAVGRGQNLKSKTTMTSAAKVLLARREDGERLGGPLSLSPTQAAALQDPSKKSAVAGRRNPPTAEVDELVDSNSNLSIGRGGDDKAETQLSRWRASNRFEGRPDSAPRILNGSNTRRLIVGKTSTGESPERNERRSESRRVSAGGESVEQPPQPDAIASLGVYTLATAAVTLVDGRPATGQQQLYTPQQGGVRWDVGTIGSGTVGTAAEQGEDGGAEGEVRAGGHHGSTSEATRRLLREALRVKRVLAEMDKADATGSAIDNGLGDEDPEKFLASLGLVELKPLSARLVEALERAPRPLLGDPSVAVPEPRTTWGLRDQVAALGKEVAQRTEACAEARKLHAALRRQVEVTRRARARNLDRVDVTCRTLIAKAGGEVQVLHESRRVAHEAERYHATLARIQEQVEATTGETRKIVSTSEAIAWELRAEMEGRGGELSCRKRDAEEGLADWERAAQNDPDLRARRRAYDCEVLALRHRMGCGGANNISLASAFHLLRARTAQQRRAREWFARSTARRNALLVRSAFSALARGSRSRAATAAVAAARCRRGLAAWKRAATLARKIRTLCWLRERAAAVKTLQGWRLRCVKAVYLEGGGAGGGDGRWAAGREEREDLEWRLELFRERRAKRVVLQAWRAAAQTSAVVTVMQGEAKCGLGREVGRRGCAAIQDEVAACSGWGARLRTAEALGRRHRFETQIGSAFRWWRRHRQCKVLARTAGQRRAIRRWRHRVNDIRSSHEATAEARGSYVLSLGRRVLAAWSSAAATRARRRTGAASLASALAFSTKRRSFRQWAFQAAAAAREADNTVVALGHYGDRCLRDHLRAWSAFARERCALRRCVGLLLRGQRVCLTAAGLRLWRRQTAKARDANLRECRIMAWTAAAARRRRFAALSVCFSAWASTRRRVAAIHSLTRRAAARRRRLALAVGFRAFSLSGRRAATATAAATAERSHISRGEDTTRYNNGHGPRGDMGVVVEEATAPVQTAIAAKVALEGKVSLLRAGLAQEKARALERHAAACEMAKEVARSERERARYAKVLRQQVKEQQQKPPPPLSSPPNMITGAQGKGPALVEPSLPWHDGFMTVQREDEEGGDGEVAAAVVEEPYRSHGRGKMGPAKLTEKESLLIIKLQAETRELRQREAVAAKQEERLRLEAARKAAATAASLESGLAERNRLKAQAEQHEVLFAQLNSEAQQAAAQAAALSDRLAGAEQDLGFEATRNTQELRERNEGNARLRAAATAAEERIAIAESTLRRKGLEIEELRSKCAKAGLGIGGRGKGGRQGRGGRASDTAGLEFRIFAASADARSALEKCTVAADERRTAAGSVLAEALRVAGSEADTIKSNEADFDCTSHEGGVAAARRIAAESVADERREVADLALREAEAKLRHSADLSVRASLDHRPLANPRSLFEEGATTTPSIKVNNPVPGTGDPARPENRKGNPNLRGNFREEAATEQEHPIEQQGVSHPARNKDGELARTGETTLFNSSSCPPSSSLPSGGHESDNESGSHAEGIGEAGRCPDPGVRNEQGFTTDADGRQHQQQEPAPKDGLRELKREISDLEGKILERLGGSGGGHDDRLTERYPSGGHERNGNVVIANSLENSARGMTSRHGQRQQQQQRPPRSRQEASPSTMVRRSACSRPSFSTSMRATRRRREAKVLSAGRTRTDRDPHGVERTRRPQKTARSTEATSSCPDRVHLSWDRVSAISSAETPASGRSGESRRGDLRRTRSRSDSFAAR